MVTDGTDQIPIFLCPWNKICRFPIYGSLLEGSQDIQIRGHKVDVQIQGILAGIHGLQNARNLGLFFDWVFSLLNTFILLL
jgi:hypothetical protein